MATRPEKAPSRSRGFTLIELLVALVVMAMLALLSWRSLDSMRNAQAVTQSRSDQVLRLQAAMGQWRADLDALVDTGEVEALSFDGSVLRLTRRDSTEGELNSPGLRVVAWTRMDAPSEVQGTTVPHWQRWQSPPLRQRNELARAWTRAQQWGLGEKQGEGADPRDTSLALLPIDQWQLAYHRGATWGNPLSSAGNEIEKVAGKAKEAPNGVRLTISVSAGQGLAGPLTLDWVQPNLVVDSQ